MSVRVRGGLTQCVGLDDPQNHRYLMLNQIVPGFSLVTAVLDHTGGILVYELRKGTIFQIRSSRTSSSTGWIF